MERIPMKTIQFRAWRRRHVGRPSRRWLEQQQQKKKKKKKKKMMMIIIIIK
jgi:hypothetical protein